MRTLQPAPHGKPYALLEPLAQALLARGAVLTREGENGSPFGPSPEGYIAVIDQPIDWAWIQASFELPVVVRYDAERDAVVDDERDDRAPNLQSCTQHPGVVAAGRPQNWGRGVGGPVPGLLSCSDSIALVTALVPGSGGDSDVITGLRTGELLQGYDINAVGRQRLARVEDAERVERRLDRGVQRAGRSSVTPGRDAATALSGPAQTGTFPVCPTPPPTARRPAARALGGRAGSCRWRWC